MPRGIPNPNIFNTEILATVSLQHFFKNIASLSERR